MVKKDSPIITPPAEPVRVPMTATIPTGQYANISPQVEGIGETFEEAHQDALNKIEQIYASVASPVSFQLKDVAPEKKEEPTHYEYSVLDTNVKVAFDEANHVYAEGWLSGSAFAHMYAEDFDSQAHANRMSTANTTSQQILDMWKLNAETSTSFGTALHNGLELRGKYAGVSKDIKKGTLEGCLNKNPIIRELVTEFYDNFGLDDSFYEPFVANQQYKLCGFIDKLKVIDREKKIVRIQDYKTNADILKEKKALPPFKGVISNDSLGNYWLQLSFYAFILEEAGYTVEGLDIFWPDLKEFINRDDNYTTCWKHFESDVIDISDEIRKIRK